MSSNVFAEPIWLKLVGARGTMFLGGYSAASSDVAHLQSKSCNKFKYVHVASCVYKHIANLKGEKWITMCQSLFSRGGRTP
jgi:hypothetical protein